MTKIDLDIDKTIPKDVEDIIRRMEIYVLDYSRLAQPGHIAHIVSQMMQQIYYLGKIDGNKTLGAELSKAFENLGLAKKEVQS